MHSDYKPVNGDSLGLSWEQFKKRVSPDHTAKKITGNWQLELSHEYTLRCYRIFKQMYWHLALAFFASIFCEVSLK